MRKIVSLDSFCVRPLLLTAMTLCGCQLDDPMKCTCESATVVSCFANSSFDNKTDCALTHQVCFEGKCAEKQCTSGDYSCSASGVPQLCIKGRWNALTPCETGRSCSKGLCESPSCHNGFKDDDEDGVDCGDRCSHTCPDCSETKDSSQCAEGYFCDAEGGYVCSKKCTDDTDCKDSDKWDGQYCRKDFRCASKVFETEWTVTRNNEKIILPYVGDTLIIDGREYHNDCAFQILWGDENASVDITAQPLIADCNPKQNRSHTYAMPGTYSVKIIGTYDGWGLPDDYQTVSSDFKLTAIKSFGPVGLSQWAFLLGTENFKIEANAGIPDATKLRTMRGVFAKCGTANRLCPEKTFERIRWDTANVTDMSYMFSGASTFNQEVPFDTKNVTNMRSMFSGARAFNQPVNFNTSNVTDMSSMFENASAFNQPLNFDTTNVANMSYMFSGASAFNQPLNFDTANVTNMSYMFRNASAFNQPVNFNTSNVTYMSSMFENARAFDQPLKFNTSNVTDMSFMFRDADAFNQPLKFNTSNVTNMSYMFLMASAFNQPLKFNTSNVKDMQGMFSGASAFNQPLEFDTANVTDMRAMFANASAFNQPMKFNTSNVTDMSYMFRDARAFDQPLDFDTSNVKDMNGMFKDAASFNQEVVFDTANVTDMSSMFEGAIVFNQIVEIDPTSVTTMSAMFKDAASFNQELSMLSSCDNLLDMSSMFEGAKSFNYQLVCPETSVTDISNMFNGASAFDQDISVCNYSSVENAKDYLKDSGISDANYCRFLREPTLNNLLRSLTEDANVYFGKTASCTD